MGRKDNNEGLSTVLYVEQRVLTYAIAKEFVENIFMDV